MVPLAAFAALAKWGTLNSSSRERRMPAVSTGVESRTGLAFSKVDTTMVATCPPFPPLIPDVSLSRASSHSMTICPPDLYHDVACTAGMNLAKKVSVSASW